jgi:hypothetical protein
VRDLIRTAAVAEMLLITDHSRMKFDSPDRYDPTSDIQMRLLPFSHPDKFLPAGASEPADDD